MLLRKPKKRAGGGAKKDVIQVEDDDEVSFMIKAHSQPTALSRGQCLLKQCLALLLLLRLDDLSALTQRTLR